ncbi:PRG4 [Branchiostoma lanceolatum]|uniref:PRG4 protein n=1 Tax=Branchiostoma lanceolatum TaxID=7740 RepID=A0A8J9ZMK9_BRALA|nr:PRG4 [Branchiostoma lanceolatum]
MIFEMSSNSSGKGLSGILVLLMLSQMQASKANSWGQHLDVPNDNAGPQVTVHKTPTDGTAVTNPAPSERGPDDEAGSDLTPSPPDPCKKDNCTGRCGSWKKTYMCQCDVSCKTFSDCCDDYKDVCRHQESAVLTNDTTTERAINTYSCQWRCNDEVRAHGALCSCNASCSDIGNCCEDYRETCVKKGAAVEADQQFKEVETLQCIAMEPPIQYNLQNHYWMLASCPTSFPRNEARTLCEEKHSFAEDPLLHLPILSKTSSGHKSYKNVFCAVCNNAPSMIGWVAEVNCRRFVSSFKEAMKSDRCSLELKAPAGGEARKCFPTMSLSSISPTCGHAEKCKGSPSPILVKGEPYRAFRNIYCAKCTLGDLFHEEVICGAILPISQFISSLQMTIDFTEMPKTVVTEQIMYHSKEETFSCPHGNIFDPFLETCRKVTFAPPSRLLSLDTAKQEGETRKPPQPKMTTFTSSTPCQAGKKPCKGTVMTLTAWNASGHRLPLPTEGIFYLPKPKVPSDSLMEDPRVVTNGWDKGSSVTDDGRQPTFPTPTVPRDTTTSLFKHVSTSLYDKTRMQNGLASTLVAIAVAEKTSVNLKESTLVVMHSSSYAMSFHRDEFTRTGDQ